MIFGHFLNYSFWTILFKQGNIIFSHSGQKRLQIGNTNTKVLLNFKDSKNYVLQLLSPIEIKIMMYALTVIVLFTYFDLTRDWQCLNQTPDCGWQMSGQAITEKWLQIRKDPLLHVLGLCSVHGVKILGYYLSFTLPTGCFVYPEARCGQGFKSFRHKLNSWDQEIDSNMTLCGAPVPLVHVKVDISRAYQQVLDQTWILYTVPPETMSCIM